MSAIADIVLCYAVQVRRSENGGKTLHERRFRSDRHDPEDETGLTMWRANTYANQMSETFRGYEVRVETYYD